MGKSLKTTQRTIAAVSVASMALLNVGIMAPANAQGSGVDPAPEETVPVAEESNFTEPATPSSIPKTANLKITKKTPDASTKDSEPNGTAIDPAPGDQAVEGAQFTLYLVEGVDLSTNAGWREANRLVDLWKDESDKEGATRLGGHDITKSGDAVPTNGQGIAAFNGKKTGLYVVRETIPAGGVTVDGKNYKEGQVLKAKPFVVALPMTDQNDTANWLETVNVYPKNSVTAIEKSVMDEQSPGTGNTTEGNSNIVYTIKTDIPKNTVLEAYNLVDPLDARLTYVSSSLSVVNADGSKAADLEEGTDYNITEKGGNGEANPASKDDEDNGFADTIGKWYTVEFTSGGLTKLSDNGGKKVQWDLTANVGDTVGKTDIENQAYLIPDNEGAAQWKNNDTPTSPPGTPSNKVVSKYGSVTINKVGGEDGEGNNIPLTDATFELYRCDADGVLGDKVTVDNEDTWTTKGEDGNVTIDGLQLNDFKNNSTAKTAEDADAAGQQSEDWVANDFYCLKETKAPAGYELLPNPIQFQLLQNDTDFSKTLTVENVPNNGGFNLPLTGGKGIFGLVALGALLVLGSIGYIFLAARRRQES